MYFLGWIILVGLSLWVSLTAFLWGLQSGQFSDQERARYLPLRDELPLPVVKDPAKWTVEVYVLMSIGVVVMGGMAVSIFLSFWR
jgi:cbb3-type cytochrome oxidase maturation protein